MWMRGQGSEGAKMLALDAWIACNQCMQYTIRKVPDSFKKSLAEDQIYGLVTYVRSLARKK